MAAGDFGKEDMPLKARLDACRRCDLWRNATQGVAGRGPSRAKLMLVGEQPGDEEDLAGEAFVGPAGKLRLPPRRLRGGARSAKVLTARGPGCLGSP